MYALGLGATTTWVNPARDENLYLSWVGRVNAGANPVVLAREEVNAILGEIVYWLVGLQSTDPTRTDLTTTRMNRAKDFIITASETDMTVSNSTARAVTGWVRDAKETFRAARLRARAAGPAAEAAISWRYRDVNPDTILSPEEGTPWGLILGLSGGGLLLIGTGVVLWRVLRRKGRRRR